MNGETLVYKRPETLIKDKGFTFCPGCGHGVVLKIIAELIDEFGKLKQSLINASKEDSEIEVNEIKQKWDKAHDKLAYYIEHDELEKVETNLTSCKSLAETENYDLAISELEKTVFVLNHITDKYAFNLENIF